MTQRPKFIEVNKKTLCTNRRTEIFSHVHILKYVDPNYILQCPESCETPCINVKAEKVLSLLRFKNILNSTCFVIYFIIVLVESMFSPSGCVTGFLVFILSRTTERKETSISQAFE